jgi:hypothetical protein
MPRISHQKQPKHAKITPSAAVPVGIVSQSLPASNMHRNAIHGTRQRVIAKQAWLILPWAGPGACRASGGRAGGGGQQRAAACRRGSPGPAGRPGA